MSTPLRVGSFVGLLAVVLLAAVGVGRWVGPLDTQAEAHGDGHESGHESGHGDDHEGEHVTTTVDGLAATASGYTLHLLADRPEPGRQRLAFHVLDDTGEPVTAYDVQHEKELHLVVVRRDLTGFQHVHPVRAADGTWSVDVDLTPGAWRVLADTAPSGGEPVVLGADLLVPGDSSPEPLGEPTRTASVDGYDVTLGGLVRAGADTELALTVTRDGEPVTRDGEPVTDLEPYLGASGHLIALRADDLGYLHVHPEEDDGAGPAIRFHTSFPSAGTYRLFLDFQHQGVVRTAAFTVHVEDEEASHEH